MRHPLPSFFIAGAQKCGTTTLHGWLTAQSDICLPKYKETHYFSDDEKYSKGLEYYLKQYKWNSSHQLIGEVDPSYLLFKDVPKRIKKYIISPKFIFIFRHPIERAHSHYIMSVQRGHEELSFKEAICLEEKRLSEPNNIFSLNHHSYMKRGEYCQQVMRYQEVFPDSEYHYAKFDDFHDQMMQKRMYHNICQFLGITQPIGFDLLKIDSNPAGIPRSRIMRDLIHKEMNIKKRLKKIGFLYNWLVKLAVIADQKNKIPMKNTNENWKSEIPEKFIRRSNEESEKISKLTGLDTQNWIESIN